MEVKDLLVTGDARILGKLYFNEGVFGGGVTSGDSGSSGVTYRLTKSGSTITLTGSDGSTSSVTDDSGSASVTYSAGSGLSLSGTTFSLAPHVLHSDSTEAAIKASDSNEVNFGSNTNYIYFGYENRVGSSGKVSNYKFGTHSGSANAVKGIIECGEVIENGTTLSGKYAAKSHSHTKSQISDFPTSMPASDVSAWAKASTKPSYAWSEITGKPSTFSPSSHTHDDRYYTESEVNNLVNSKAPAYQYSTTDLTAGSSALTTGTLYFVYE